MIEPTNWWKTKLVMFIAEHTPKCHEITRLISQSKEQPLPWRTRLTIRVHYTICVWCVRYRNQLGFISRALQACPERGAEKMRGGLSAESRRRLKIAVQPKA